MKQTPEKTIGQMAVESPHFIPVFEKHALDYYEKGDRTLTEACEAAGLETEKIRQELGTQKLAAMIEKVDEGSSLSEIVHYIVQRHHAYVRGQLERMEALLVRMGMDDRGSSQAGVLKNLFLRLDESLRHHLLEEEIDVFPRLLWIERQRSGPSPGEGKTGFLGSVYQVLLDHRMMDQEFRELKKLALLFTASNRDSKDLGDFLRILEELDQDNHQHIHLENNVLLRKAKALGIIGLP